MSLPNRGPDTEGDGSPEEPVRKRRASILLPEEDEIRRATDALQELLNALDTAGEHTDICLRDIVSAALNSADGEVVHAALEDGDFGWTGEDFGDKPVGQVALQLRDELVRQLSKSRTALDVSPHPLQPTPSAQLADVVKQASVMVRPSLPTKISSLKKAQTIPGQSRPGAPPSNQFNTGTTSLFILSGDTRTCSGNIRYKVFRVIDSTAFERAVLLIIMANSITLALDIPSTRGNNEIQKFLQVSEIAFQSAFTVEMLLKIIALGFVMHPHSYLRSYWNKMDFVVVMTGFVSLAPGVQNYSVLRLLRVARPLRVVNRVPQMKSIMNALIQSLPGMRDVFLLLAFLLVIFAIVGVQLFEGKLHQRCYFSADSINSTGWNITNCNEDSCLYLNDTSAPCSTSSSVGRQCSSTHGSTQSPTCTVHTSLFKDSVLNFDTFYSASLLVFKVISLDDWPADMHNVQNAMGWGVWIYFLLITLFGAFFCINLFLAVLSLEYYRAKVQAEIEEDDIQKGEDEIGAWELESSGSSHPEVAVVEEPCENDAEVEGEEPEEGDNEEAFAFGQVEEQHDDIETASDKEGSRRRRQSATFLTPSLGMDRRQSTRSIRNLNPSRKRSIDHSVAQSSVAEVNTSLLSSVRKKVKLFVQHAYFSHFMLFVTCFNVIVMTLDYHNAPRALEDFINWTNLTCSFIFICEMLIKWLGLGLVDYFTEQYRDSIPALVGDNRKNATVVRRKLDGYNTFDCVLVMISIPELALTGLSGGGGSNFSAFRIFRMARMLRLLGKYPTLRQLLLTIIASVVAVAYLFLIMLLFIFICGILGLQLFENSYPPDSRANFNSLWESFLTVFIVITGESWATIMSQAMQKNAAAFLYFVPLFIFGNYMLINLFIAILIDEFMRTKEAEELENAGNEISINIQSIHEAAVALHPLDDVCAPCSSAQTMPSRMSGGLVMAFIGRIDHYCFGEARAMRDMTPEQKADAWDLHGKSLFFFELERTNPLRLAVASVVMHPLFNLAVLTVIFANVVFLAVDHPQVSSSTRSILELGDITFTTLFTIECMMKVIVMGLYEAKDPDGIRKAYLTHMASERSGLSDGPSSMGVWNRMDMFVVITAFAGIGIKELKLCRSLRTIRLVVHSEGIRVVITSLFRALSGLANVTVVCLFLWLSFGIIAVQLYKGTFYYCNDADVNSRAECVGVYEAEVQTAWSSSYVTSNRTWHKLRYNFDNLGASMLTLFEIAVGEGWAVIMYSGIDARGVDLNPKRNANPINALFFCLFVVVGQFFAMNLFVGMLIEVFTSSKAAEEGSILMTTAQRKWVRANKMLSHTRLTPMPLVPKVVRYTGFFTYKGQKHPLELAIRAGVVGEWTIFKRVEPVSVKRGVYGPRGEMSLHVSGNSGSIEGRLVDGQRNCSGTAMIWGNTDESFEISMAPPSKFTMLLTYFRTGCFHLAIHPFFDNTVTFLIILNVFIMCLKHYKQPAFFDSLLGTGNWFFVVAFTVEAIVKVFAHGGKKYFRDDWNKFDFILVIMAWVGVLVGGPGLNVLRVLRIGRVFRLIKRAKNLQKLFGTLVHALPSLGNVSLLLVVTFFIFGVVGVELFGSITIPGNQGLTEYTNFKNVPYALITLYQVATTETWTDVMDGCMATEDNSQCSEADNTCGTVAAIPYFVLFMLVGSFALLNLFITIVLDEFNNLAEDEEEDSDEANWTGLKAEGWLKTNDKLQLMDNFRARWLRFDPLATGRVRANAFITIMRVWCTSDKLTQCEVTDLWLLRFLMRVAMPIDEQLMVRYEDAVQSLSKQLFQISLNDAMGIQKFVQATQWKGDEYLMVAHYFATQKILAAWRRKQRRVSKQSKIAKAKSNVVPDNEVEDNIVSGSPAHGNEKADRPENGSHLSSVGEEACSK